MGSSSAWKGGLTAETMPSLPTGVVGLAGEAARLGHSLARPLASGQPGDGLPHSTFLLLKNPGFGPGPFLFN